MVPGLSGGFRLPERAVRLRQLPRGFRRSINISGFCDKDIDAKMEDALALGVTDRRRPNKMWAEIDKAVTDKAPAAVLFTPKHVDFVSKRLGNFQFNAQYLLDGHRSPGCNKRTTPARHSDRRSSGTVAVPILAGCDDVARPALGPWAGAGAEAGRDQAAMAALVVFLLIVLACVLAPLYASYVAHTDPFTSNTRRQDHRRRRGRAADASPRPRGWAWAPRRSARPGTSATTSWAPTARAATSSPACSMAGAIRC